MSTRLDPAALLPTLADIEVAAQRLYARADIEESIAGTDLFRRDTTTIVKNGEPCTVTVTG